LDMAGFGLNGWGRKVPDSWSLLNAMRASQLGYYFSCHFLIETIHELISPNQEWGYFWCQILQTRA
jgi:hypothetical protein